ncbi:MAG: pyrroline-5-carboxylate reductase [Parvularculales bacterium]
MIEDLEAVLADFAGRPLVLVGAGRMGGAMLLGWLKNGLDPALVFVRDPSPSASIATEIAREGVSLNTSLDVLAVHRPAALVLSVKPQIMDEVVPSLAPLLASDTVVLSIVTGKSIATMETLLEAASHPPALVRAMPNIPASVGCAMTVVTANGRVSAAQRSLCSALLEAVGVVEWIEDEVLIEAVTALSGSGPAYVFLLAEAMADAGVDLGLEPEQAMRLARATLVGAGALMAESEAPASSLREGVTSPGGTTAAALSILMDAQGLKPLMARAMKAACDRARELGG